MCVCVWVGGCVGACVCVRERDRKKHGEFANVCVSFLCMLCACTAEREKGGGGNVRACACVRDRVHAFWCARECVSSVCVRVRVCGVYDQRG